MIVMRRLLIILAGLVVSCARPEVDLMRPDSVPGRSVAPVGFFILQKWWNNGSFVGT